MDARFAYTHGSETPTAPIPKALGGAGNNPVTAFSNATNFPGLVSTNQTTANSLLYFMAGSMASASQYYFIQSPNAISSWLSYVDLNRKILEPIRPIGGDGLALFGVSGRSFSNWMRPDNPVDTSLLTNVDRRSRNLKARPDNLSE